MQLNKKKYKKINLKIFLILSIFTISIIMLYLIIEIVFFSKQLEKISVNNAIETIDKKEKYLNSFLTSAEKDILSLRQSNAFKKYLINSSNSVLLEDMYLYNIKQDKDIMQIRYINNFGKELIRIQRDKINGIPYFTKNNKLQDKSKQYYFTKSKSMNNEQTWFSNLDLNIENGDIEVPYKSTLRVILPTFKNGLFEGIIIINYFMDSFLTRFINNSMYDITLIDKDGFTLLDKDKEKSWGRYKTPQVNIFSKQKELSLNKLSSTFIRQNNLISKKLQSPISNDLIVILKPNINFINEERKNELLEKITISSIIFIISMIAIFIISNIIRKVILDLLSLNEYTTLINENVITSTTNLQGKIVDVSEAFCKISGYSSQELLGVSHNIVRHPDETNNKYTEMWNNLKNNQVWEGELLNKSKLGLDYWVKAKIYPIYDEKNKKVGYTAIRQDITDKKKIEELSITNSLTKVYNRRYFDEMLPKIINASKRNNSLLSFIMLDIDFFKLYNDTYGHQEGDKVLIEVSKVFRNLLLRSTDYCFRIGGEEFAIIINVDSKEEAIKFTEKIRKSVEDLKLEHSKNEISDFVTVSIGLVSINGNEIENKKDLYKKADDLLYQAKESGRNKVIHNIT